MVKIRRLLNVNSFYLSVLFVGAILLYALLRDGFSALDLAWLAIYAVGCVLVYRWLRTPPAKATPAGAVEPALQLGKPTLVEFYSDT